MIYTQLLHEILRYGSKNRDTIELMHVPLRVPSSCLYQFEKVRPLSKTAEYMMAEFAWYLSGDRDHTEIAKHAELWRKIKNEDGTLNSNYGHLVFYNRSIHPSLGDICLSPFEWAARCLEKDVDSRQGMVTYNTGGFNYPGNKDYICSQHQAFYIRNGKLLCYIALRSSDAIYGLTYNMPWWQFVYQQMFLRLRKTYPSLELTDIKVTIYSAHIYTKHINLVEDMLAEDYKEYNFLLEQPIPLGQDHDWYKENLIWTFSPDIKRVALGVR